MINGQGVNSGAVALENDMGRLPALESALGVELGRRGGKQTHVWCFEELPSTMDEAKRRAPTIAADEVGIVLAKRQTNGRGRQGRAWIASEGNLSATYILQGKPPPAALSSFSLVVGTALREFCRSVGVEVVLKWPNDVLSHDLRKLAGVLIEASYAGDTATVLVGVGMNLIRSPETETRSISLYELSGRCISTRAAVAGLTPILAECWGRFLRKGFGPFRERWLAGSLFLGRELTFEVGVDAAGEGTLVSGRMTGISPEGALVLETRSSRREIVSGHLVEVEGVPLAKVANSLRTTPANAADDYSSAISRSVRAARS